MIKKLILIAVLLTTVQSACAQAVKSSFGIKFTGNADFSNSLITPEYNAELGGGGGAFLGLTFGRVFGIQGEALYSLRYAGYYDNSMNSSMYVTTIKHYLDIPVTMQLWCGKSFMFEFGYQQSILMESMISENIAEGFKTDMGAFDYGSIIAGFTVNMGRVAFLNFRYAYALSPTYVMKNVPTTTQHTAQIGLGFRFYTTRTKVFR